MLRYFYDKYGLTILLVASVCCIVVIFLYNFFSGKTGTYQDHTKMIWDLLGIPYSKKPIEAKKDSLGELECRRVAEKITGKKFPKQRPDFLRNSVTDANLEIDCFNQQLGIGIEYNGRQHYEFVPHFHQTKDAFYNTRYRDEMKQRLCAQNGIKLIIIPYSIPVAEIENYLSKIFRDLRLKNR